MLRRIIKNFFGPKSRGKLAGVYFNAFEIDPENVGMRKVVPIGEFPNHHDGAHVIEAKHIKEMADNIQNSGTDVLFDFGHNSIWNPAATAAGWSPKDSVEARADGLYIKFPTWTKNGAESIENGDYRYLSPAYILNAQDKKGRDIGAVLHSVGLVNKPYMDTEIDHINSSEVKQMFEEEFLNSLGLPADATAAQVQEAIRKEREERGTQVTATLEEAVETPPAADTNAADNPVLAELQKINSRLDNLESGRAADQDAQVEQLLNSAINDMRILPREKEIWVNSFKQDFSGTKDKLLAIAKNSVKPGTVSTPAKDGKDKDGEKVNSMSAAAEYFKTAGRYPNHAN